MQSTTWKLTPLYQKFDFMAIFKGWRRRKRSSSWGGKKRIRSQLSMPGSNPKSKKSSEFACLHEVPPPEALRRAGISAKAGSRE
jgi:hypothetical protein